MDDMVIKTPENWKHVEDLEKTFASTRRYNMRLNPKKTLLGYKPGNSLGLC